MSAQFHNLCKCDQRVVINNRRCLRRLGERILTSTRVSNARFKAVVQSPEQMIALGFTNTAVGMS